MYNLVAHFFSSCDMVRWMIGATFKFSEFVVSSPQVASMRVGFLKCDIMFILSIHSDSHSFGYGVSMDSVLVECV